MRKILITFIVISLFICCRKTAEGSVAERVTEENSFINILSDTVHIPEFHFDSAQVQLLTPPYCSLSTPFIFHFQNPEGGRIGYTTYSGHKYDALISEEFSKFAFMALDSLFVLKTIPIILSRKDAESYAMGYTPPEMVFKIYKGGELIIDEKIILLGPAAGYVTTYSPLFDRLKNDLFNVKDGMFEYWFHFKENSGLTPAYRYNTSSSTEEQ